MPSSHCPDENTIEQYLCGLLEADQESLDVEHHLLECEQCLATSTRIGADETIAEAIRSKGTFDGESQLVENVIEFAKRRLRGESDVLAADTLVPLQTDTPSLNLPDTKYLPELDAANTEFLSPPQQPDEIGRLGNYRILELIGYGGMGIVFRAEDIQLRRRVALKVIKPGFAASQDAKDRFLIEARATAAIEHDNLVDIYQVGEHNGVAFLSMQFLTGESLQDRLDNIAQGRAENFAESDILRIGREIAEGLDAAHKAGLIHRDVKPDNIWLHGEAGRVKILDFGLARSAQDPGLTQTGQIMGTPRYMSPEQAQGLDVDARVDLFSLGCVLYRMTTGQLAFDGTNLTATLMAVAHQDHVPVLERKPDTDPELATLIEGLLAKQRDQRPASAEVVVRIIVEIENRAKGEEPTVDVVVNTSQRDNGGEDPPRKKSHGALGGAGGIVALLLLLAIGAYWWTNRDRMGNPDPVAHSEIQQGEMQQSQDVEAVAGPASAAPSADSPTDPSRTMANVPKAATPSVEANTVTSSAMAARPATDANRDATVARGKITFPSWPEATLPDPQTLLPPGAWKPGSEPDFEIRFPGERIRNSKSLPGLASRPANLDAIGRWNFDTRDPRTAITTLALSPSGNALAVGSEDGHVRIYSTQSKALIGFLPGFASRIETNSVAWHPTGDEIAIGSYGANHMRIWSTDGKLLFEFAEDAKRRVLHTVTYSPDGSLLAAGGADSPLLIMDRKGMIVATGPHSSSNVVDDKMLAWSPDSNTLASIHEDGVLRLWNRKAELITELPNLGEFPTSAIDWKPDGSQLAVASLSEPGLIHLVSSQGEVEDEIRVAMEQTVIGVRWSADGDEIFIARNPGGIASVSTDGKLEHFDNGNYHFLNLFDVSGDKDLVALLTLIDDTPHVVLLDEQLQIADDICAQIPNLNGAEWSPDGSYYVTAGDQLRCWTPQGELIHSQPIEVGRYASLKFSPTQQVLAAVGESRENVWAGDPRREMQRSDDLGAWSSVSHLSWNHDGTLFTGLFHEDRSEFEIFDAAGQVFAKIECPELFRHAAFHPTEDVLAIACEKTIFLTSKASNWKLKESAKTRGGTSRPLLRWSPAGNILSITDSTPGGFKFVEGQLDPVAMPGIPANAAWLHRGDRIAHGGDGFGVEDIFTRKGPFHRLPNVGRSTGTAVSPDDRLAVASVVDGQIIVWSIDSEELLFHSVATGGGATVTFSSAGQIVHSTNEGSDDRFVYYARDPDDRIRIHSPEDFARQVGGTLRLK